MYYMWFVVLGILGGVLFLYSVKILKKRKEREASILATLGLVIAFASFAYSVFSANSTNNEPVYNYDNEQNKTTITGNSNQVVVVEENLPVTYNYYTKTEEISLASAQRKMEVKDYSTAIDIYLQLLDQETETATVQCNLGYCYAMGLGTEIDLEKAVNYYDEAIIQGSSQALCNKLALYLENDVPLEQIGNLIWSGIDAENVPICKFVTACLQDNESVTEDDALTFCKDVNEISADELWDWQKSGLVKLYSTPTSTGIVRYTAVSSGNETRENFSALYTIYQTEERYCPYIHLLQAGFDSTR